MIRRVGAILILTTIYALALASVDPWDLLFGALLATALVWVFPVSGREGPGLSPAEFARRAVAFWPFVGVILWEIVVGTWMVLRVVVGLRPLRRPGIVAVPLGERTRLGVAVSTLAVSLSPGSSLIAIDWERRVMLLHLLDASDPDAFRASLQHFYERYQRRVFP